MLIIHGEKSYRERERGKKFRMVEKIVTLASWQPGKGENKDGLVYWCAGLYLDRCKIIYFISIHWLTCAHCPLMIAFSLSCTRLLSAFTVTVTCCYLFICINIAEYF